MLLEGGIFVKTWTSQWMDQISVQFLKGKLPAVAFGSLLLGVLEEQELQTLRNQPAQISQVVVKKNNSTGRAILTSCIRKSVKFSGFNLIFWTKSCQLCSLDHKRLPWNCGKFSLSVSSSFCRCKRPETPKWKFHLIIKTWRIPKELQLYVNKLTWSQLCIYSPEHSFQAFIPKIQMNPLKF